MSDMEKHEVALSFTSQEELIRVTNEILRSYPSVKLQAVIDYNIHTWRTSDGK